jgi:hypothetical protein
MCSRFLDHTRDWFDLAEHEDERDDSDDENHTRDEKHVGE